MWDSYETAPYSDCWLVEWQSECFMYSVKHFLPHFIVDDWITDEQYENIKRETGGICPVRDKLFQGQHVHNHDWNMPPRHMKSSIMNVCGPVWFATNTPRTAVSVSHTASLSGEMNKKRQKLLESEKYKYYFSNSDVKLRLKQSSGTFIELLSGAMLYSTCMVSFTGKGADLILADDLISADNAAKDKQVLKNALTFFQGTLPTRLNSKNTGVIWHIQQRLAPGDISGNILSSSDLSKVYSHTELQAISDKNVTYIYPCSGKVKEIKVGDRLWESRFGNYDGIKLETGPAIFDTQYQQNARASDSTIIKEEYIHYIEDSDIEQFKNTAEMHYASHDCPVKESESSDFHGYCEGYGRGSQLIITDGWEQHLGYIKEKQLLTSLNNLDPAISQIIEDKANGAALLQDLKNDVPGMIAFKPGTDSKSQRLQLASVYVNSGAVLFAKNDRVQELIQKLLKFPFLIHDDIVDAFSQLVLYHFTQQKAGVYTNCFTYQNIIEDIDNSKVQNSECIFAASLNGTIIKVCQIYLKDGNFIIHNEWQFRGIDRFEQFYINELKQVPIFLDASYENSLYNIINNSNIIIRKFNDKDRDKSVQLLKIGYYKKKILVEKHCVQTANDISKLRNVQTTQQIIRGTEVIETFDEGFSGCVRAAVTYQKGLNGVWY